MCVSVDLSLAVKFGHVINTGEEVQAVLVSCFPAVGQREGSLWDFKVEQSELLSGSTLCSTYGMQNVDG